MSSPAHNMEYVRLGKSGLRVSKLILGTMSYGNNSHGDWVLGEEEAAKHIKAALDYGINTFDTADIYSNGESEAILGRALKTFKVPREDVVILTKVFFATVPEDKKLERVHALPPSELDKLGLINRYGLSRKHIFDAVKGSLERLQVDYIDVFQCHRFDYNTPIEETMQALHDVVKAGYVRYIGMSSCHAYQFHQMQNYAIANNLTPFISMQNHYNGLYREEEREMIPTLDLFGVGMIPWSPLAQGGLSRPFSSEDNSVRGSSDVYYGSMVKNNRPASDLEINRRVQEIAHKRGLKMAQVALAWVLSKQFVTAPIVGTTKLESLKELVEATKVKLTEEEIKAIEEPYVPVPLKGHS